MVLHSLRSLALLLPLAALAASPAQGAPCVSGSTIFELSSCAFGTISVSNGANSWTLSNFGADNVVSTGYPVFSGVDASPFVRAEWAPYTFGNQFGFSITFSAAGNVNFFAANGAIDVQQAAFNTNATVTSNDSASNVLQYGVFLSDWSFTDNTVGDVAPAVRVNTGILDPNTLSSLQADHTILFRNPVNIVGITQPDFSVVNAYQIYSGQNGASASISSYSVYFLPTATTTPPPPSVPEPTAMVLLGSAVLGLVARRRRRA